MTLPLYFRHSDVSIYNAQGNEILKNATGDLNLFTLPALQWVLPVKIFDAHVGVSYMQWIDNGVLDLVGRGFRRSTNYGFGTFKSATLRELRILFGGNLTRS